MFLVIFMEYSSKSSRLLFRLCISKYVINDIVFYPFKGTLSDMIYPSANRSVLKIKSEMQRALTLQQWTVLAEELDR